MSTFTIYVKISTVNYKNIPRDVTKLKLHVSLCDT